MDALEKISASGEGVDEALRAALRVGRANSSAPLYDMLSYFMGFLESDFTPSKEKAAGKRFRFSLCIYIAEAYGAREKAFDAAVAIELFHHFTLIHDDLEDRDEVRRNRPTVWKIWGDNHAINSGDMQSLLACEWAMKAGTDVAPLLLSAFKEVVEGQYMDFELADASLDSELATEENALCMTRKKTGALVRVSAEVAGVAAGVALNERALLRTYGDSLGIAFQLADDYRSVWSPIEKTGKDAQSDIREHKLTVPVLAAYEKMSEEMRRTFLNLYSIKGQLSLTEIDQALSLIGTTDAQEYTRSKIKHYAGEAQRAAESLSLNDDVKETLVDAVFALASEGL